MSTYAKGTEIKVELVVRLPEDATWEQVEEWLQLELTRGGTMKGGNPLGKHDVEGAQDRLYWSPRRTYSVPA